MAGSYSVEWMEMSNGFRSCSGLVAWFCFVVVGGMVWDGMVRCGAVRCGTVRCDVINEKVVLDIALGCGLFAVRSLLFAVWRLS